MEQLKSAIRDIPDFPEKGIIFKDITPLLADGALFKQVIDHLKERHKDNQIDLIIGIEARGFIFASALAYALGTGTVLIRKPGKLPHTTHSQAYELEYGFDAIEIHHDSFHAGQNVLIIDDVLATGGTVSAAVELIQNNFDVNLIEIDFLMELDFLNGREKLTGLPIHSMLHY